MSEPMATAELIGSLIILFPLLLIVAMAVYAEIQFIRWTRKWLRRWLEERESDEQN